MGTVQPYNRTTIQKSEQYNNIFSVICSGATPPSHHPSATMRSLSHTIIQSIIDHEYQEMCHQNDAANKIQKWWLFTKGVNCILAHNLANGDCQPILISINRQTEYRYTEIYAMMTVEFNIEKDVYKLDIGHSEYHMVLSFESKLRLMRYLQKYVVKSTYLSLVYSNTNMIFGGENWFGGRIGQDTTGMTSSSSVFENQWKWFVWGC